MHHLVGIINERRPTLVILDSLGEAFGLEGMDENKDSEVGPWLRAVARTLADAGPAVVLVDHSTKANDNPLRPSGSKHKRAAIGGAGYLVVATKPLGKGPSSRRRPRPKRTSRLRELLRGRRNEPRGSRHEPSLGSAAS